MSRRPKLEPTLVLVALALGAPPPPASAQEALPGVFAEIIDVRVVNLEVVVTDKDGVRVSGLQAADFVLDVDGKEMPIEYFTEVLGGTAVATGQGGAGGLPSLQPGAPVGTSYLLFVDEFFTVARDRDVVLEALAEDLPLIGPGDRMAIVAYDGKRLEMLSTWSTSAPELERVLKAATRRPAFGLQRRAELNSFLRNRAGVTDFRGDRFPSETRLDIDEERFAHELSSQVQRVVGAAAATLRGFASPPGRKVMLLIAGGWPFEPTEYAAASNRRMIVERGITGGAELLRPLSDTANRLGYTLYPVDAPGLMNSVGDVELSAPQSDSGDFGSFDFVREQSLHASLGFLADETGGRALLNSNRLDSLPEVAGDTRSYYWLGFSPPWRGDDKVHDIRVRPKNGAYKVRARDSFEDLSRRSQVSNLVESALLFGNAPSSRPLELEFGRPKRAGFGTVEVPVTIRFPARDVTLLPGEGGYRGLVEVRMAVLDARGERSDVPVTEVPIVRSSEPPADLVLAFSTALLMRKGRHDVIISVYDPIGGNLLSSRTTISP